MRARLLNILELGFEDLPRPASEVLTCMCVWFPRLSLCDFLYCEFAPYFLGKCGFCLGFFFFFGKDTISQVSVAKLGAMSSLWYASFIVVACLAQFFWICPIIPQLVCKIPSPLYTTFWVGFQFGHRLVGVCRLVLVQKFLCNNHKGSMRYMNLFEKAP